MQVLFVDHSRTFRTIWQRMMTGAGYAPEVACNASEALMRARARDYDLICIAYALPDHDGITLTRGLRALPRYRDVPVLLMTSQQSESLHREAFSAGVTDVCIRTGMQALFDRVLKLAEKQSAMLRGRVLYVEDSRTVSQLMIELLESMGLSVDHFTRADRALEAFDPHEHDLVISDLLVEGELSGVALVRELRQRQPDPVRLPLLAMSGLDDAARRVELFRLGINDFISKPVVREEAAARIRNLVIQKQLFEQVQRQREQLYQMAMTDPLTGLFNRHSLDTLGGKITAAANRHDLSLSVIVIDLDHFKTINDQHGHLAGDQVLAAVADLLRKSCREEDFAVRLGGEELMLILPRCSLGNAERRAEELRQAIETLKPASVTVTGSFGVSSRPKGGMIDLETLINDADQAVYAAKAAGRNTVVSSVWQPQLPKQQIG